VRRLPATPLVCAAIVLGALGAGCGEGGAAKGATVSVYVSAPLCPAAERELGRERAGVEDLHVRAVCLPPAESRGRLDLARIGAGARRATEDATTVAYLAAPGPGARFSQTIVESADIAWLETGSGAAAVRHILKALESGGSSSPRDEVRESLSGK
jgi:hypothetical protein